MGGVGGKGVAVRGPLRDPCVGGHALGLDHISANSLAVASHQFPKMSPLWGNRQRTRGLSVFFLTAVCVTVYLL